MKDHIKIVLVNTSHPGNIGATARAMKTMGFKTLALVNPKCFPHDTATAMAAGADDILAKAEIASSLAKVLENSQLVFGTSARLRKLQLPLMDIREAATLIHNGMGNYKISLVFGRENNGLTNGEFEMCTHQIHIPTNPTFSSLNVAAAVQLICYEIHMISRVKTTAIDNIQNLATTADKLNFFNRLKYTLTEIDFLHHQGNMAPLAKLKLIFNRAQLKKDEIKIFHGILSNINKLKNS